MTGDLRLCALLSYKGLLTALLLLLGTSAVAAEPAEKAIKKQISTLGEEVRVLAGKIHALEKERIFIKGEITSQKKKIAMQEEQMRTLMRLAHRLGPGEGLQSLLGDAAPGQLGRFRVYHEQFGHARSEQITTFRKRLQSLEHTEQRKRTLEHTLGKTQRESLAKKTALEKRLQELLQAVEERPARPAARSAVRPFAEMRGRLAWPVSVKPINRFGDKRAGGRLQWRGVILPGKEGSPVRAIHPGRVVFADWFGDRGLLLVLNHGDGYMSLYGSNSSLLYDVDSDIEAGAAIATVGHSGDREENGLYFEIRHRGQPLNPALWCRN